MPEQPAAFDLAMCESLVDGLLFSVSHDLRSPLLTINLGAELIDGQRGDADGTLAVTALEGVRAAARDLERMLQAVTSLSRARRRAITAQRARLALLLGGHAVISEDDLAAVVVNVDAFAVRELLDTLYGDQPARVQVRLTEGFAALSIAAPPALPSIQGAPLLALAGSLQTYAGTLVESLAVSQILLARQNALMGVNAQTIALWLPLAVPT